MTRRTPAEVYGDLVGAGFSPAQATTMTAIAGAESGYDDTSLGDVNLETNTWGPSYGLFQVRTVKQQTGSGSDRDIRALAASDAAQARAAYDISHAGTDFTPWSVYTSGKYQAFVPAAAAASSSSTGAAPKPFPTLGPAWLPWNLPSDLGNAAADKLSQTLGGVRAIAIEGMFVVLGLGLLVAGAIMISRPGRVVRPAARLARMVV